MGASASAARDWFVAPAERLQCRSLTSLQPDLYEPLASQRRQNKRVLSRHRRDQEPEAQRQHLHCRPWHWRLLLAACHLKAARQRATSFLQPRSTFEHVSAGTMRGGQRPMMRTRRDLAVHPCCSHAPRELRTHRRPARVQMPTTRLAMQMKARCLLLLGCCREACVHCCRWCEECGRTAQIPTPLRQQQPQTRQFPFCWPRLQQPSCRCSRHYPGARLT